MKLAAGELATAFRLGGGAASGASMSLSMALIGVGHLVGMTVGIAMLIGMLIAWGVLVPVLTSIQGIGADVAATVNLVFRNQVRFIGAGTIGVAAVWTLLKIIGPIVGGIRSAMAASAARSGGEVLELTERDLPIGIVGGTIVASLVPIAGLLWWFIAGGPIAADAPVVIGATLVYMLVIGAIIAAVCGYMAGLIGASNSPVSGVGILAVLGAAVLLSLFYGTQPGNAQALTAYALFTTAIVFSIATISNDNLQDLKTGQLVGATPWKQQVALIIGVIFGSLVIGPVLNVLNTSFGFQGMPGAGPNALAAPQAALISSLANGVLGGDIRWDLIGYGALTRGRRDHHRRSAHPHEQIPAPAAGGRHGRLSADGAHHADPGRGVDRLALRGLGRARRQSRIRQAHGRARRDRPDRWRESVRRRLRRHRRGNDERCAAQRGR